MKYHFEGTVSSYLQAALASNQNIVYLSQNCITFQRNVSYAVTTVSKECLKHVVSWSLFLGHGFELVVGVANA